MPLHEASASHCICNCLQQQCLRGELRRKGVPIGVPARSAALSVSPIWAFCHRQLVEVSVQSGLFNRGVGKRGEVGDLALSYSDRPQ